MLQRLFSVDAAAGAALALLCSSSSPWCSAASKFLTACPARPYCSTPRPACSCSSRPTTSHRSTSPQPPPPLAAGRSRASRLSLAMALPPAGQSAASGVAAPAACLPAAAAALTAAHSTAGWVPRSPPHWLSPPTPRLAGGQGRARVALPGTAAPSHGGRCCCSDSSHLNFDI